VFVCIKIARASQRDPTAQQFVSVTRRHPGPDCIWDQDLGTRPYQGPPSPGPSELVRDLPLVGSPRWTDEARSWMSLPGGAGSPGQGVHPEPRAAGSASRVHPEPEFTWAPGLPGTRVVRGHLRVPDKSGPGHTGRTQVRCPEPRSVCQNRSFRASFLFMCVCLAPKPYKFIGFGDIHGPKSHKFIRDLLCVWRNFRTGPSPSLSFACRKISLQCMATIHHTQYVPIHHPQ
jgi:hypothetical protein